MMRPVDESRPVYSRTQRILEAAEKRAESAGERLAFIAAILRALDRWWHRARIKDGRTLPSKAERAVCLIDMALAFASIAWVVRASFTVALLLALLMILPDQAIDAFQELSEGTGEFPGTVLITAGTLLLACLSLWHWARAAVYTFAPGDMPPDRTGPRRRRSGIRELALQVRRRVGFVVGWWRAPHLGWPRVARRWCARYLPRLAGVVPLVAFAGGAFRALWRRGNILGGDVALLLLLVAALIGAAVLWRAFSRRAAAMGGRVGRPGPGANAGDLRNLNALSRLFLVIWLVLASVLMLLFTVLPWLAMQFAPIGLLAVSAALAVSFGSMLVWVDYRTRIPTLPVLLVLALWFSGCNWNDNHAIRRIAAPAAPPVLSAAYQQWLKERGREDDPFPVVLVCAEGGGIYAAYHTAMALSEIQAAEPRFAPHIFAISGVSGGSVGAAVFAALTRQESGGLGNWGPGGAGLAYPAAAHGVLARDFLSPVLSYALFPDLVQRFIPGRIGRFDRARALDGAFERGFQGATGGSEMAQAFGSLWSPAGSTPALVLNTTHVETGDRVAIAPFVFDGAAEWKLRTLDELSPGTHLRLSTAAGASARFPIVTPAARLPETRDRSDRPAGPGRLADGGYFDNSGASTIKDILSIIVPADAARSGAPPFKVLVIRIGTAAEAPRGKFGWQGLGESLSPVRTLLNTRGARGRTGLAELRQLVERIDAGGTPAGWVDIVLDTEADRIPLGWLLSKRAREAILAQLDVSGIEGTSPNTRTTARAQRNREAMDSVLDFVRSGRLPSDIKAPPESPTKQMQEIRS